MDIFRKEVCIAHFALTSTVLTVIVAEIVLWDTAEKNNRIIQGYDGVSIRQ